MTYLIPCAYLIGSALIPLNRIVLGRVLPIRPIPYRENAKRGVRSSSLKMEMSSFADRPAPEARQGATRRRRRRRGAVRSAGRR